MEVGFGGHLGFFTDPGGLFQCFFVLDKLDCLSGLQLRVRTKKLIFLFLSQNICCGYSKEPSQ